MYLYIRTDGQSCTRKSCTQAQSEYYSALEIFPSSKIVRRIEAIVGHLLCFQDFALGQVYQSSFTLDYAISPVPFVHLSDKAGFEH
jgi:hypothetical protein